MGIHNSNGGTADGNITDDRIIEVAGSIMSFCMSRTSNQHNAEDLSQEIMLELVKSLPNLRDEKTFYGFMWAVAGNVYRQWCTRRTKSVD